MRRTVVALRLVNTNWSVGSSKGQAFMGLKPTQYLYRFQRGKEPTPYISKYLHTLGTTPTGLDIPFRLQEFRDTYLREHVPIEVEEWLACFTRRPAAAIGINVAAAVAALEACETPQPTLHRRAIPAAGSLAAVEAVQLALGDAGVDVPAVAVRYVVERPKMRAQLARNLEEWSEAVQQYGSTPHRRLAARQVMMGAIEDAATGGGPAGSLPAEAVDELPEAGNQDHAPLAASSSSPANNNMAEEMVMAGGAGGAASSLDPRAQHLVRAALTLEEGTALDERLALQSVTLLADAAQREARYDLAERLLRDGLRLAHDEDTEGAARANYASALNGCGRYAEAEAEAREAVLLCRAPRAYANWSVAVAYQDDWERATEILEDGLEAHPGDATLAATADSLGRAMAGREAVAPEARGRRIHSPQAMSDGTARMSLSSADRRDYQRDPSGRVTVKKLDPRDSGLGQEMRRSGPLHTWPLVTSKESY